jgi:FkbM family methyltransferase
MTNASGTTLVGSGWRSVRRIGLSLLAHANPGDVSIKHHYTQDRIRLHSFRHKGYWFHGRRREQETMEAFARLVKPGDCVLEAGGHIGYISLYFAQLAGASGSVHVFEPGSNNLPYLWANAAGKPTISVIPKGLGHQAGVLPLHLEDLTGQNNSLVPDFAGLASNERYAVKAHVVEQLVEIVPIDSYVAQAGLVPDFIKVDVEGYEWEVLAGASETLARHRPAMMVEVQSRGPEIARMLHDLGYRLHLPDGREIDEIPLEVVNVFCIPPGRDFWRG